METYTVNFYGDNYSIRANFSQWNSPIERLADGEWIATGRQVADFMTPDAAMRFELDMSVVASGDDICDPYIRFAVSDAITNMVAT